MRDKQLSITATARVIFANALSTDRAVSLPWVGARLCHLNKLVCENALQRLCAGVASSSLWAPVIFHRPVNSVGRAPVCRAGGRGLEPWPDQ